MLSFESLLEISFKANNILIDFPHSNYSSDIGDCHLFSNFNFKHAFII